jgi:2',3'-cyclic-nucleotide 2'-phosphodiesterase (5'-nucleotidase family)
MALGTRRRFGLLACVLLILTGLHAGSNTPSAARPGESVQLSYLQQDKATTSRPSGFTILQINDVYKIEGIEGGTVGGLARVRTLRSQIEAAGRPVVVLHAGDFLFPSVMSKFLRAQPMIRCLNLLDGDPGAYDPFMIVTFGNHEFDDRDPALLLGRVAQSDFTYVSSNVRYRSAGKGPEQPLSSRLTNVRDDELIEIGGIKVGVFGLTIDAQPRDWLTYGYDTGKVDGFVRAALDRLRSKGAQLIVALTHQDIDQDVKMARTFPEIDLVIGGHEHFFMQRHIGKTWVTKADADVKSAITIDVNRNGSGQVTVADPKRIMVGSDIPKDRQVEAEVQSSLAELARVSAAQTGRDLMQVVGSTETALEGVEPAVRGRETALGNFLADAIRDRTQADLGFLNGGAIRINDNIPAGSPIRVYDLEGIFYFDNNVVSFELTGAELLDILRTSVALVHTGHGRFLQVSGIRFQYHVSGPPEQPAYRIDPGEVRVKPRGATDYQTLDLTRRYAVASLDYLWENGYRDGYALFAKGKGGSSPVRVDNPAVVLSWRTVTEEAIKALPGRRVTTGIEGRIVRIEGR